MQRATQVRSLSPHRLRATVPAHAAGAVGIRVVTNHGTASSAPFTFVAPPTVTAVDPPSGTPAGGNVTTVRGGGFYPAAAVRFGAMPAANVQVVSRTKLIVTAPAQGPGVVDITVSTGYGNSAMTDTDHYSYTAAPLSHHDRRRG
jgi:hypothetical protein